MDLFPRLAASSATFRDEPLGAALERLAALGFARVGLVAVPDYCEHFDPLLVDVGEEECARARGEFLARNLRAVSVTGVPANPLDRRINRDAWLDMIFGYTACARGLGAETLILSPGEPAPEDAYWRGEVEHAKPWLRDAAGRALAARLAPALTVAPGTLLSSSRRALELLTLLGIPSLGVAIDTALLAHLGEDPARAIRALGGAVAHVTLRDTDGTHLTLPPGSGGLDFSAILDALTAVGYAGPLMLLNDDITQPPEARADSLLVGWHYLDRISLGKAA
ncbi:MAG TPA: sugar phosphate isomerase/epimerase [Armatimonadota bacterium]|nr:sugar phosphate isomerase/epimerase [Armatimonadota bacterium]